VPRANDIEGKQPPKIDAKKGLEISQVVLGSASKEGLDYEQCRHLEKEPGARVLRRRQYDFIWRTEGHALLFATMPPHQIQTSESS